MGLPDIIVGQGVSARDLIWHKMAADALCDGPAQFGGT
jgi:hypothetical protein